MTNNRVDILIVCTGNICRSPMAEGLLKHLLLPKWEGHVHIHSAGTYGLTGNPAEPHAVRTMEQMGIDIRDHRARPIDETMICTADFLIVMEEMHRDYISTVRPQAAQRIWLLGEFGRSGRLIEVADPYGGPYAYYVECALFMKERIDGLADHLTEVVFK